MDEMSWQARLARNNINILNVDDERWYYEFMYHPYPGSTKWCKTFYETHSGRDPEDVACDINLEVAKLRRELER